MKTLLYITTNNIKILEDGVKKKIDSQIEAFERLGFQAAVSGTDGRKAVVVSDNKVECEKKYGKEIFRRVVTAVNTLSYIRKNRKDVCYVRFNQFTFLTIIYFKMLRKYTGLLILEAPTYPFPEYKGLKKRIFLAENVVTRYMRGCIDRVLYVGSKTDTIFGCASVQIPNGMALGRKLYRRNKKRIDGDIRLIAVSTMFPHHGYDRLIEALEAYYKSDHNNKSVYLTLVGKGMEYERYVELVKNKNLQDKVFFKGCMTGNELEEEYRKADIGVGSLNITTCSEVSTLKTKEYLQLGIPFIYVTSEIGLPKDYPYALQLSCGHTKKIDIDEIIRFAEQIKKENPEKICAEMQQFAMGQFGWKEIFERSIGDLI